MLIATPLFQAIKRLLPVVILWCGISAPIIAQQTSQLRDASAEKKMDQVLAAISDGELDQAEIMLRKVLATSPRNPEAHTIAGILADKKGNLRLAAQHFSEAARISPTADAHNNYGAILLRLAKVPEASREFEASLKINPNQISALVNLAKIKFDEGNLSASRLLFEKARSIKNDSDISVALLIIALRFKEVQNARAAYQLYASLGPTATAAADRIKLSKLLLENGLVAEAAKELESVLSSSPDDVDALVLLSRTYIEQNDIPAAGRLLESAVARGIEDARIYAGLSKVYRAGGYFENSIPAMRLAIQKAPKEIEYLYNYGLLLVDSKAPAAAIIRLSEYVKEFPQSAQLWLGLGIAYQSEGKAVEAKASFDRALAIDPKMLPALAYVANTYTEAGQSSEAARIYERAIRMTGGKEPIFQYLLADVLTNIPNADQKRIEALLKTATDLDPRLGPAFSTLGTLYIRQNNWTEAQAALERSAELQPDDSKTAYQLSRVYARLKKQAESEAQLIKFKRLDAEQKERSERERRELVRKLARTPF